MTKAQRQECEALSLELFKNKNFYKRIENRGLNVPVEGGALNIRFTDEEILAFLHNTKANRDKNEAVNEEPKE